jgi:L-aminopeptidase/D-esterase-like protein
MKEIKISEIEGFRIGHAQDEKGGTGCTAIICENGAVTGCEVRGGGPASRETPLLDPVKNAEKIQCVMLSGGSAFGLAAGDGAMLYLEEHKIGYELGPFVIPLVVGASIFDLAVGEPGIRPGREMGRAACAEAFEGSDKDGSSPYVTFGGMTDPAPQGNVGAGLGATVGKINGPLHAMKSGLGVWACESEGVKCGAIAVVNALGDVKKGDRIIAGCTDNEGRLADSQKILMGRVRDDQIIDRAANTTRVCVITNALVTKGEANKVAQMMHDGFADAISPVHTSADGDTTFCMAGGVIRSNTDALAALAREATKNAIINAALNAEPAYGLPAAK